MPTEASRYPLGRPASGLSRYVPAVLALGFATLARLALDPALGDHLPYVTYFVAVAFVAWWSGLGPSIFALLAGWWLADFFFFSPRHVWYPHGNTPAHLAGAATYFMVGLSSIAVCEAMRRAQRRSERDRELLRVTIASIGDAVITTDDQGRVLTQNPVAVALTGWQQHEAEGKPLEEVFRIVSEETRASVESPVSKVLAEGKIVGLANHTVLIGKDGREHAIDDSTAPIRDADGKIQGVVLVFRDVSERRRLDQTVEDSEARKAAILETALDSIVTIDHTGKVLDFNPAAERTFGYSRADSIGREMAELIVPPALREAHRTGLARYLATGEGRVLGHRLELTGMRSNGEEFPVELAITRISGKGNPVFTGHLRDITDRKRAHDHLQFLLHETSHRSKNLLVIIQAIAGQTARSVSSIDEFEKRFTQRLQAIAVSHELLVNEDWIRAKLDDLVRGQLSAFAEPGPRLELTGATVFLTPNAAQQVGLALHELATNAVKYGAWSVPTGKVKVSWLIPDDGRQCELKWQESGGPLVAPPTRLGFGSTIIDSLVAQSLNGTVMIDYATEGFSWILSIPCEDNILRTP